MKEKDLSIRNSIIIFLPFFIFPCLGLSKDGTTKTGKIESEIKIQSETSQEGLTLEKYLKLVLTSNPQVQEAKHGIEFAESYLDEIDGTLYPKIKVLGFAAPTPAITGNAANSNVNWSKWGPWLRGEIDVQLPLYTFGRIPRGREAAINAISVEREKVKEVVGNVIVQSKEIFYGRLFAYSAYNNVLLFAEENLNKALEYAEDEYDAGTGKVSKADLGRLKVAQAELLRRKAGAEKFLALTQSALGRLAGYKNPKKLKIALKEIEAEVVEIKPLDEYIRKGFVNNPQLNQLHYGIKARKALVKFEDNFNNPVLFLAGKVAGAWAPHIENQKSYFASDSFNEFFGGIAVGILWEFDLSRRGKIKRAEAEYKKLLAKQKFAIRGIPLLIEKAYLELIESKKTMEANYKGYRAALGWMAFSFLAFQSGTGEAKDALEGLGAVAIYHYNYYESIFQFNVRLAKLSQLVGEELAPLKYQ